MSAWTGCSSSSSSSSTCSCRGWMVELNPPLSVESLITKTVDSKSCFCETLTNWDWEQQYFHWQLEQTVFYFLFWTFWIIDLLLFFCYTSQCSFLSCGCTREIDKTNYQLRTEVKADRETVQSLRPNHQPSLWCSTHTAATSPTTRILNKLSELPFETKPQRHRTDGASLHATWVSYVTTETV